MMKEFKYLIFLIGTVFLLNGCGGGNDDKNNIDDNLNAKNIAINSRAAIRYIEPNSNDLIDIKDFVRAENNQSLIIKDLKPLDNNCRVSNINGLFFNALNTKSGICRFRYTVAPMSDKYSGYSSNIIQIVSTLKSKNSDYLPPISRAIRENETITLSRSDLILDTGFIIDSSSVLIVGDTDSGELGDVTSTNDSISYQAPSSTLGHVAVYYSEINPTTSVVKPGVIYIAIGQTNNENPIAIDEAINNRYLTDGEVDFDISHLISDSDGDKLQLVYITSNRGFATITSDVSFAYDPKRSGDEFITYIVSDHNGGYGIGNIKFRVSSYHSIIDKSQNLEFTPPLTSNDLGDFSAISGSFIENGSTGLPDIYPTFDYELAKGYCTTQGGFLPTESELSRLFSNELGKKPVFDLYKWHSGKPFLAEGGVGVSLYNGTVSSPTPGKLFDGYISCVRTLSRSWEFASNIYRGVYNSYVPVYIIDKIDSDRYSYLPNDLYNMKVDIYQLRYNGIDIPEIDQYKYIKKIEVLTNTVRVIPQNTIDINRLSLVLELSDSKTTTKTKVIYGISKCPSGIDPIMTEYLMCINSVDGFGNDNSAVIPEKFTLALSDSFLKILGVSESDLKTLGTEPGGIGGKNIFFRGIKWNSNKTPINIVELRKQWLNKLTVVCDSLNTIKFDGRSNWSVGGSIPPKFEIFYFDLNTPDAESASKFVSFMVSVSGSPSSAGGNFGQGYVNSDYNSQRFVNQMNAMPTFSIEDIPETISFPSCWSRN